MSPLLISNETILCATTPCCIAPLTKKGVGLFIAEESEVYPSLKKKYESDKAAIPSGCTWKFPNDIIQEIFSRCASSAFLNLCHTDVRHYVIAYELLHNRSLCQVQLCPNLTILNPFNIEKPINLFKVLQLYHKFEPTVEGNEGITLQIRPKLTLNEWVEVGASNGIIVDVSNWILYEIGNVAEPGEIEWEMISNAPVTETRLKKSDSQNIRVVELGYDEIPPEGAYLHNIIFTQKAFGTCLSSEDSEPTYGRTSTKIGDEFMLTVGNSKLGYVEAIRTPHDYELDDHGAAGLKKISESKNE